jgi:hypothetical protein
MKPLILLTGLLLWGSSIKAQTITIVRGGVPGATYTTLKAAIAASSSGDVLQFSAHTFKGYGDTIMGKTLHLKGTISGKDTTTLDAEGMGRHLMASSKPGMLSSDTLIVEDIVFCNGKAPLEKTTSGDFYLGGAIASYGDIGRGVMKALYIRGNTTFRNNTAELDPDEWGYRSSAAIQWNSYLEIGDADRPGTKVRFLNNSGDLIVHCLYIDPISITTKVQGYVDFEGNTGICLGSFTTIIDGFRGQINFKHNKSIGGMVISVDGYSEKTNNSITGNVYIGYNESIKSHPYLVHNGTINFHDTTTLIGPGIVFEYNQSDIAALIQSYNNVFLSLNRVTIRHNTSLGTASVMSNGGTNSKIEIRNCDIHHNTHRVSIGATIFNNPSSPESNSILIEDTRMYNPRTDGTPRVEVKNMPNFTTARSWWGSSDTAGLFVHIDDPRFVPIVNSYAVANWSVNKGAPITTTSFPIEAQLTKNDGSTLFINAFPSLVGEYFATEGSFSTNPAPINSTNLISSRYTKGTTIVPVMAVVDADTFLTDSDGLSISSTEKKIQGVTVFPNPAATNGTVHIQGLNTENYLYTIIGIDGKALHPMLPLNSDRSVSLQEIPNGQYIIAIKGEQGHAFLKCNVSR